MKQSLFSSLDGDRCFPNQFLLIVLLLAASLCLGWTETWEGIRAAAGGVEAISADFVQEKHLPILVEPLVSTGRMFYRRPDALRWEYTSPLKSVLLMRNGETRRFVQSDQGMVEDAGARMQAMQFVMPEISGWLEGRFEDNPLFIATLQDNGRILLVPKDSAMSRFIQRIELILSERPGVIDEVVIVEGENAFTRIVFDNTRINPALADGLFQDAQ